MFQFRQCVVYLTLALMFATLWTLGYARQCEDQLHRAQHAAASPELGRAAENPAEMERASVCD